VSIARRVLLAVSAVLALAGCRLDVGVDVTMRDDGTGTVTVTAVADAALLARVPGALADLELDDLRAGGWSVDGPRAADGGGQQLVVTKPFVTPEQGAAVLGELSGGSGPLRNLTLEWSRSFATVRTGLAATAGLDGGIAALGDGDLVAALGGRVALSDLVTGDVGDGLALRVTAHLPGAVVDANGTVAADGSSVTWTPDLRGGSTSELRASFVQRDDGALAARSRARWIRIGLAVWGAAMLAAVVVVGVLVARRRGARTGV
jgi:hypothetical protein